MKKRIWRTVIVRGMLSLVAVASFAGARAAELGTEFSTGIAVSDNIARTAGNTTNETISLVGLVLDLSESTRKLDASLNVDLTYMNYLDNTFADEIVGGGDLNVDLTLVDERLSWTVEDNFGQQLGDPFASTNPGNRENVNYLTTGPTLTLPLSSRNSIGLDLMYSAVNYEVRPFDNKGGLVALRLDRQISRGRTLSLNGRARNINYEGESLAPDIDILETYLRFAGDDNRGNFNVDIGLTELSVANGKSSGLLVRANWLRQVSPFATLNASASSQYSEQGDLFRYSQGRSVPFALTQNIDGFGNAFRNYAVDVDYALNRERSRLRFGVGWRQEDYQLGFARDRDILRATFFVERDVTRNIFVNVGLRLFNRAYKYIDREDTDTRASMSIGYRFGPAFRADVEYNYVRRKSTNAIDEYRENRAILNLTYVPSWGR